jgi:ADP-ribose pyrophosphatase YjhB (NUDIX family)
VQQDDLHVLPFSIMTSVGSIDGWRFCPRCAGELRVVDDHRACRVCGQRYWANPVPGVQAVVADGASVLLGRRRDDPGRGLWDLPGGFLHEDEAAIDGLRREIREETGLEIEPVEFLGTWNESYWDRTVLCLTWVVHVVGGREAAGDDLVELRWFDAAERPRDGELAFPTFESILSLWASRHEDA